MELNQGIQLSHTFKEIQHNHLQEKISHLQQEIERLSRYEMESSLFRESLFVWLLEGRVTVSEIPQAIRLTPDSASVYTHAFRNAESKRDAQYGIEVLRLFKDDLMYLVSTDNITEQKYSRLLIKWLGYMKRGKIAFKGDKDFDGYFQQEKGINRGLFDAAGLSGRIKKGKKGS